MATEREVLDLHIRCTNATEGGCTWTGAISDYEVPCSVSCITACNFLPHRHISGISEKWQWRSIVRTNTRLITVYCSCTFPMGYVEVCWEGEGHG